ncbi:hypothetical protein TRIUR3_10867 [Triticum urartu]|uniref:Uncharacterized protein n=1 Tax=Triticum urartu TaxID=4572 RepID=M7YAJ2_TRIUA|nr:hypothetical protein TRIUR3_10867 [Triticum urartu]
MPPEGNDVRDAAIVRQDRRSHAVSADGGASAWTTALQKHVAFFDADNDGIVSFFETEQGLRAIGLGAAEATVKATLINGVIGPKTRPVRCSISHSLCPSLFLAHVD